jgi:hypothetical protein
MAVALAYYNAEELFCTFPPPIPATAAGLKPLTWGQKGECSITVLQLMTLS